MTWLVWAATMAVGPGLSLRRDPIDVVIGLAVVALAAVLQRRSEIAPEVRAAGAAVAALILGAAFSPAAGVVGGASVVLGSWAAGLGAPSRRLPRSEPTSALPVLILTGVAGLSAGWMHPTALVLLPLTIASLLVATSTWGGGATGRFVAEVGAVAGRVVATVLFTLLGLPIVLGAWVLQRVVGTDPLGYGRGWARRVHPRGAADSLYAVEGPAAPAPRSARLRSKAVAVGVAAALCWVALGPQIVARLQAVDPRAAFGIDPDAAGDEDAFPVDLKHPAPPGVEASEDAPGFSPDAGAALAGDLTWWDTAAFRAGQGWVSNPEGAWRAVDPYRTTDFRTEMVSVVDGSRRTWRPPACECRRLSVWLYGGSTTFGLNQRDEHTIASYLARVAHDRGVTIDVSNRGKNGHHHWLEAELFALDLTVDDPPDLVVFYDGWNDRWASANYDELADGVRTLTDPSADELWRSSGRAEGAPPPPPGARLLDRQAESTSFVGDAQMAMDRYDHLRALSRPTAARHGVVARYVWQPSRYSRDLVLAEPHFDTDTENFYRATDQWFAENLPADVIDLTDALDGEPGPLFTDDIHHSERGARLVAEALYMELEGDLLALAEERGEP